jgi:hypothetical protein
MENWTVQQVGEWLRGLSIPDDVVLNFTDGGVDGRSLLLLTDDDLKNELGVKQIGPRKKIMAELEQRKGNNVNLQTVSTGNKGNMKDDTSITDTSIKGPNGTQIVYTDKELELAKQFFILIEGDVPKLQNDYNESYKKSSSILEKLRAERDESSRKCDNIKSVWKESDLEQYKKDIVEAKQSLADLKASPKVSLKNITKLFK